MITLQEYIENFENYNPRSNKYAIPWFEKYSIEKHSIERLEEYFGGYENIPNHIQEKWLNHDDSWLDYILETLKSHDSESFVKAIKERYKDDPNVVDDIVGLIHKIGSYNVRMALELITDDEIDELDED